MSVISEKNYRTNIKKILDKAASEMDASAKMILNEVNDLIACFPGSPEFIGFPLKYPKIEKGLFRRKTRPDITNIRLDINNFANKESVSNSRIKLQKLLKKFPDDADLHALNAVQLYHDAMQSGLDERKFDVFRKALQEIAQALYNGGMSIFNVNWFVKIYLNYLEVLSVKIRRQIRSSSKATSPRVQRLVDILRHHHLELMIMVKVRQALNNLTALTTRLKGTDYITEGLTEKEIFQACRAYQQGDETRKVGKKTANHIIYVLMTVNMLFTKIPIMSDLIVQTLHKIPDQSRDLALQKQMILTAQSVHHYQLAMARGDKTAAQKTADHIFTECKRTIKKHLEFTILTKYYEVDPFIKAAWIAAESKEFYSNTVYRQKLQQAHDLLKVVMGERSQYKGSYEAVKQLQADILYKMTEAKSSQSFDMF